MKKVFYIQIPSSNKAKSDIDVLFAQMGYCNMSPLSHGRGSVARFLIRLYAMLRIVTTVKKGDVLCLQYPMKKFYAIACRLTHLKGGRVVTIIHDLGAFRRHKLTVEQENRLLANSDFLIVHNAKMRQHLLDNGCEVPLYCLEIFDFLTTTTPPEARPLHTPRRVAFAGKLAQWRNEFLYQLDDVTVNWELEVYGTGFVAADNTNPRLHYHGSIAPDDFVTSVEADFGLVWDGSSMDECDGEWGRYLLINNPHKTSFYLRAGIPVIVWAEAAMAPFIQEQGIGICVHSLRELNDVFARLTDEQYAVIKQRAMQFSDQLGNGYFARRAFQEALTKVTAQD